MSQSEADLVVSYLGLPTEVSAARVSDQGLSLDGAVPVDPPIYRFHEITQVHGTTFKALIHEMFGDGMDADHCKQASGNMPCHLATSRTT